MTAPAAEAARPARKPKNPPVMALRRIGGIYGEVLSAMGARAWALDPEAPARPAAKTEEAAYEARRTDPEWDWLYGHWGEILPGSGSYSVPVPGKVTGPLYRAEDEPATDAAPEAAAAGADEDAGDEVQRRAVERLAKWGVNPDDTGVLTRAFAVVGPHGERKDGDSNDR